MQLGIIQITYKTTAQPKCSNLSNAFYGRHIRKPRRLQDYWTPLTVQMRSFASCRVCLCERERETGSQHSGVSFLNCGLFADTYEHHHCVFHANLFPSQA